MLQAISELTGMQERHSGGHNWPDMEIVVDAAQIEIEDGGVYLIHVLDREPVIKKCRLVGNYVRLDPALAPVHGQVTVELFGRMVPCQTVEFSDTIHSRYITVCGRVVGLWARND